MKAQSWPALEMCALLGNAKDGYWALGDDSSLAVAVDVPRAQAVRRLGVYVSDLRSSWSSRNGTSYVLPQGDAEFGLFRFERGEFVQLGARPVRGECLAGLSGPSSGEDLLWVLAARGARSVLKQRLPGSARWQAVELGLGEPCVLAASLSIAEVFIGLNSRTARVLRWSNHRLHELELPRGLAASRLVGASVTERESLVVCATDSAGETTCWLRRASGGWGRTRVVGSTPLTPSLGRIEMLSVQGGLHLATWRGIFALDETRARVTRVNPFKATRLFAYERSVLACGYSRGLPAQRVGAGARWRSTLVPAPQAVFGGGERWVSLPAARRVEVRRVRFTVR